MEIVNVAGVPAVNSKITTPQLVEVTVDAIKDDIQDVVVTEPPTGNPPKVLLEATSNVSTVKP